MTWIKRRVADNYPCEIMLSMDAKYQTNNDLHFQCLYLDVRKQVENIVNGDDNDDYSLQKHSTFHLPMLQAKFKFSSVLPAIRPVHFTTEIKTVYHKSNYLIK